MQSGLIAEHFGGDFERRADGGGRDRVAATPRRTVSSHQIHSVRDTSFDDMSDPPHHVSAFSTDWLPEQDRFGVFLEEVARKLIRLEVARRGDAPFYAHFRSVRLGAVNFVEAKYSPASYGRSRDMLADGNDDFVFRINTSSSFNVDEMDRTLRQGEGALVDNARPGFASCATAGAGLLISLPRKTFLSLLPGAEDLARLATVAGTARR